MRENPKFAMSDDDAVRRLVRENPWATLVSHTSAGGLIVSHYPVLLVEDADGIVLETHLGRPDDELHELGEREMVVIFQGPHGYISPGWYDAATAVPTWNFVTAHLYGIPEILGTTENLAVLDRLVEHFESRMPQPRLMRGTPENAAYAERIEKGTAGFRMRVSRYVAKNKMSQGKPAATVERILSELEGDGPYSNAGLAAQMRRSHGEILPSSVIH